MSPRSNDRAAHDPETPGLPASLRVSPGHSLLLKHALLVAALVVLTAGILGHLAYASARDILRSSIHDRLQLIAVERAGMLENYVAHQRERAAVIASRSRLRKLLKDQSDGAMEESLFRAEIERILNDERQSNPGVDSIWVIDFQGVVAAATERHLTGTSAADSADFLEGQKRIHLGLPYKRGGDWFAHVSVPVRTDENRLLGVVVARFDLSGLKNVLTHRYGLAETGRILVGTRIDDEVHYLLANGDPVYESVAASRVPPMVAAIKGRKGVEEANYNGVDVLAAYQPVNYQARDYQPWGLVALMSAREAYAPVHQLRRTLLGLQAALVLAGMLVSVQLVRRFTQPLRELTKTATRIARGDLNVRVPVDSTDEIGLLSLAFNHMAEQLSESRRNLEDRVDQRTAELFQAQTQLRRQTRILQSVLDSIADGVVVADQSGDFLLWNPAAEQIIGMGPIPSEKEDWSSIYGFYYPDGERLYPSEKLPLVRAMEGASIDGCHLMVRNASVPEGILINMSARPLRNDRGELRGGVVVIRDITAAIRAEEELKAREETKRAILATAHEAFVAIDEESIIQEWNEQAEQTFGWTALEAIGQSLPDLIIPPAQREAHRQGVRRFLETGEGKLLNRRLELTAIHRDGHSFPIEITIAPVRQPHGYLFSAFVHDITQQRESQAELERAREAAEAASRAKSNFLANMSHEIRTPMNAIIGMTELVLNTELSSTQREYLGMVLESAESLLSVINDILDFSKIEAGRFDLDQAIFNLSETVGDAMKALAMRAHRKGLELACHIAPDAPRYVIGDKYRLRQVLVNLAGNAIKFTDFGEIVVTVRCVAQKDGYAEYHFSVRDTGPGIPKDKREIIFDAFEQADETAARRYSGTGLGLAISSRLVELMQGRIWLESELGEGSTFHFTARFQLPAQEPVDHRPATLKRLRGLRVLIVDDNATNCRILEEMLESWQMVPTSITHSDAALPLMRQAHRAGESFDLVLIDSQMPGMNGFDLAEAIRRDPEQGSAITMMLTTHERFGDAQRCQEMGIAAWLTKPVKQSELFDAIARAMGVEEAECRRQAALALPEPASRPLKILLAEDSPVNQRLTLAQLEPLGHSIVVVNNGRDAVEMFKSSPFDLILMDVQMPELDGLRATQQIRELERETGTHVPIIAMTAHAMKGDRQRCLDAGMDDYVSKPVRASQLLKSINRLLPPESDAPLNVPAADVIPGAGADSPADGGMIADDDSPSAAPRLLPAPEDAPRESPEPLEPETTREARPSDDSLLYDWDAAMKRSSIDSESLGELVELLLQELPKLLAGCREALASGDAVELRRLAHTIKGSTAVFVAEPATQAAQRLEWLAREGRLEEAEAAFAEMEEELHRLEAGLSEKRSSMAAK